MNGPSTEDIRSFLVSFLSQKLESEGRQLESDLPDDYDLLLEGVIDSMGLLELTQNVQDHFSLSIDFEELDPEDMTVVGPFCRFVEKQIKKIVK